jgi:DNA topoisomerase-1
MSFLVKTGIPCPRPECDGEIVERVTKKKRRFYACTKYPECDFTINRKPIPQRCPKCGNILTVWRRNLAKCIACEYKAGLDEVERTIGATA